MFRAALALQPKNAGIYKTWGNVLYDHDQDGRCKYSANR
jgi:hypothetical protein